MTHKNENAVNNTKNDNARSEIQIKHNWSYRNGTVGPAILQETLDVSLEGLTGSEGRLINISEEGGCDKKEEFPSGGDAGKITSH